MWRRATFEGLGLFGSLCFFDLGLVKLFANCDTVAGSYQLGEICVESVVWEACEIDFLG